MGQQKEFTYKNAGININDTDAIKESMGELIKTDDSRVLNGLGPFASLYDISFPEIEKFDHLPAPTSRSRAPSRSWPRNMGTRNPCATI